MDTLFRIFVLKEIHGWNHETALVEYLDSHPELCKQFGFDTHYCNDLPVIVGDGVDDDR